MGFSRKKDKYVVIDLGSHSVKFLIGSFDGKTLKVDKAFSVKMPNEIFEDGRILDKVGMDITLKTAIKDMKIDTKKCIVTFNSKEIIQKEMVLPELNYDDSIGLIRYEISQYLPINVNDYDVTYKQLSTQENENGEKQNKILAYVVNKEIIDAIYEVILSIGLEPVFLDVHSNSISKFLSLMKGNIEGNLLSSEDKETVAFVDLGYKGLLIDIFEGSTNVLSRTVDLGFASQDKLICERFDVTMEEAETLRVEKLSSELDKLQLLHDKIKYLNLNDEDIDKKEIGIGEGLMTKEEKVLFDLLRECMLIYDSMVAELSKIFRYYTTREKNNHIDKVYFHGALASNGSLVEYLDNLSDFEVNTIEFDKIKNLSFQSDIDNKNAYVNAIGALIRRKEG